MYNNWQQPGSIPNTVPQYGMQTPAAVPGTMFAAPPPAAGQAQQFYPQAQQQQQQQWYGYDYSQQAQGFAVPGFPPPQQMIPQQPPLPSENPPLPPSDSAPAPPQPDTSAVPPPPQDEKPPLPPEPPPDDKMNQAAPAWQNQQWQQSQAGWPQSQFSQPPPPGPAPPPVNTSPELQAILQEEIEFNVQYGQWKKQYDDWKEQNKNHPNQNQFRQYESQFKDYEKQMDEKRISIRSRKSNLMVTVPPPGQTMGNIPNPGQQMGNVPPPGQPYSTSPHVQIPNKPAMPVSDPAASQKPSQIGSESGNVSSGLTEEDHLRTHRLSPTPTNPCGIPGLGEPPEINRGIPGLGEPTEINRGIPGLGDPTEINANDASAKVEKTYSGAAVKYPTPPPQTNLPPGGDAWRGPIQGGMNNMPPGGDSWCGPNQGDTGNSYNNQFNRGDNFNKDPTDFNQGPNEGSNFKDQSGFRGNRFDAPPPSFNQGSDDSFPNQQFDKPPFEQGFRGRFQGRGSRGRPAFDQGDMSQFDEGQGNNQFNRGGQRPPFRGGRGGFSDNNQDSGDGFGFNDQGSNRTMQQNSSYDNDTMDVDKNEDSADNLQAFRGNQFDSNDNFQFNQRGGLSSRGRGFDRDGFRGGSDAMGFRGGHGALNEQSRTFRGGRGGFSQDDFSDGKFGGQMNLSEDSFEQTGSVRGRRGGYNQGQFSDEANSQNTSEGQTGPFQSGRGRGRGGFNQDEFSDNLNSENMSEGPYRGGSGARGGRGGFGQDEFSNDFKSQSSMSEGQTRPFRGGHESRGGRGSFGRDEFSDDFNSQSYMSEGQTRPFRGGRDSRGGRGGFGHDELSDDFNSQSNMTEGQTRPFHGGRGSRGGRGGFGHDEFSDDFNSQSTMSEGQTRPFRGRGARGGRGGFFQDEFTDDYASPSNIPDNSVGFGNQSFRERGATHNSNLRFRGGRGGMTEDQETLFRGRGRGMRGRGGMSFNDMYDNRKLGEDEFQDNINTDISYDQSGPGIGDGGNSGDGFSIKSDGGADSTAAKSSVPSLMSMDIKPPVKLDADDSVAKDEAEGFAVDDGEGEDTEAWKDSGVEEKTELGENQTAAITDISDSGAMEGSAAGVPQKETKDGENNAILHGLDNLQRSNDLRKLGDHLKNQFENDAVEGYPLDDYDQEPEFGFGGRGGFTGRGGPGNRGDFHGLRFPRGQMRPGGRFPGPQRGAFPGRARGHGPGFNDRWGGPHSEEGAEQKPIDPYAETGVAPSEGYEAEGFDVRGRGRRGFMRGRGGRGRGLGFDQQDETPPEVDAPWRREEWPPRPGGPRMDDRLPRPGDPDFRRRPGDPFDERVPPTDFPPRDEFRDRPPIDRDPYRREPFDHDRLRRPIDDPYARDDLDPFRDTFRDRYPDRPGFDDDRRPFDRPPFDRPPLDPRDRPLDWPGRDRDLRDRPLYDLDPMDRPLSDRDPMDRPLFARDPMDRPLYERDPMDRPLFDRPFDRDRMDRPLYDRPLLDDRRDFRDSPRDASLEKEPQPYAAPEVIDYAHGKKTSAEDDDYKRGPMPKYARRDVDDRRSGNGDRGDSHRGDRYDSPKPRDRPIFPHERREERRETTFTKKEPELVKIEDLIYKPLRFSRPPQMVFIMRGIPGSGKTYISKLIREKELANGGSAPRMLCLDDYFMVEMEKKEKDPESGKMIVKKSLEYEYEPELEDAYRQSLLKSFKKTIDGGFYPFIIFDAVNEKTKHYEEFWSYAKSKGFQVYVCDMQGDTAVCAKRNTHKRSAKELEKISKKFDDTPRHYLKLDIRGLLQEVAITEVVMEDMAAMEPAKVSSPEQKTESPPAPEEEDEDSQLGFPVKKSKWEVDTTLEGQLDKLDGIHLGKRKKSPEPETLEEFLSLAGFGRSESSEPGRKRVRWADLEERQQQMKRREMGFVVGQTQSDWNRFTDDSYADKALNRTKYF